jgi:hypothetical protein
LEEYLVRAVKGVNHQSSLAPSISDSKDGDQKHPPVLVLQLLVLVHVILILVWMYIPSLSRRISLAFYKDRGSFDLAPPILPFHSSVVNNHVEEILRHHKKEYIDAIRLSKEYSDEFSTALHDLEHYVKLLEARN